MKEIVYEWSWQQENSKRFLHIKFNKTETLSDFLDCFSESLVDFSGGSLKMLIDLRLSENILSYNNDMDVLYDKCLSMGVDRGIAALIVRDRFYSSKEKLVNEFAKMTERPFAIKSFDNCDSAKNWLVNYKFPST
ncbi:MAG: hypothetical protein GXP02_01555 [Alphaproteobacteria bacterium]|nr:hypothetical protein [Alphaproteobacteria bacterium]